MTQLERVRRAFLTHGRVYRVDFLAPNVIDHGDPILNLGERVADLRKAGWEIETVRLPNHTALYKLISAPAAPTPDPVMEEPTALFSESVGAPRPRSHYEEAA